MSTKTDGWCQNEVDKILTERSVREICGPSTRRSMATLSAILTESIVKVLTGREAATLASSLS